MRVKLLLPALLLGVGLMGLTAVAAEKSDTKTKASTADTKKIDELIKQLGSETFDEREKAHKALDEIGEPALKALNVAKDSKDLETKKRATMLAERIEKRVTSARILAPKEVQLVFKDTPIADAVAEIAKKTGYKVKLHDPENKLKDKKVTLDTGKTTFWNALAQFCEKAGLTDGDPNQLNRGFPAPPPGGGFGGGGVQILPAPPVKIAPPAKVAPPAKKEEKKEEKKGNAADQEDAAEDRPAKPAAQPAKPVQGGGGAPAILPVPPDAVPGGGPGIGVPGGPPRNWVNVQQGDIYLIPGKTTAKAADTKTSFRVRAAETKNMGVPFGREKDKEHFWFVLEVSPEPKVRWHSLVSVKLDKAKDNNDQSIESVDWTKGQREENVRGGFGGGVAPGFPGGMPIMMPWSPGGVNQYAPLKMKAAAKETKSFKELSGTINARVLDEAEPMITVDNVMKMAGKSAKGKKGGEIKINKVSKDKEGNVTIEFEMDMPKDVQAETQQNIPIPADLMPKPIQPGGVPGVRPALPPPVKKGNAAEEKAPPKVKAQPAPAVVVEFAVDLPIAGGGVGMAMPYYGGGYALNGLTLQDAKGKPIYAQIQYNFEKLRNGNFRFDQKKMEYVAKYKAGKGMPAEPTKLVFTGRKINEVSIPFTLKDVEVK